MDPSLIAACVLAGALLVATALMAITGIVGVVGRRPLPRCHACGHDRVLTVGADDRCFGCRNRRLLHAVLAPVQRVHLHH